MEGKQTKLQKLTLSISFIVHGKWGTNILSFSEIYFSRSFIGSSMLEIGNHRSLYFVHTIKSSLCLPTFHHNIIKASFT